MSGRLVIMGSGETAPTMIKVHRALLDAAGAGAKVMVDTPFGFQANADDLTAKIQEYFAQSVGVPLEVARWRRRDEPVATRERSLALLQRSRWVFAGPGSPSYALRQWVDTPVVDMFAGVLSTGGTLVMGSAAAVTAGRYAIPVYEIYKVGQDPSWLDGLDLLGAATGVTAAVIPHYDNREGGRHDTRFCYLGEQRLELLEGLLPAGTGVIGVDEHTAVVIDTSDRTVAVHGAGGLTLRRGGVEEVIASGDTISLDTMAAILSGIEHVPLSPSAVGPPADVDAVAVGTSLRATAVELRTAFDSCIWASDADGALAACLDLEQAINDWSADTLQSDDLSVARQTLRAMLVELAGAAVNGMRDMRATVGPVVEVALAARQRARDAKDFAASDQIRDGLMAAGIEVRDTPAGIEWDVT